MLMPSLSLAEDNTRGELFCYPVKKIHKILNNLNESDEIKLLIIIAHRRVTTEKCDQLLLFKDGSLMDHGTFSELRDRNEFFKEIAQS